MIYEDRVSSQIEKKSQKLQGKTFLPRDIDPTLLQTFPYEYTQHPVNIEHTTEEFTCLCPFSGLPDFAKLTLRYTPYKKCIELKSLKYYLYSFRQVKIFNEHVVNKIQEDLIKVLQPREMEIIAEFSSRGGITNKVSLSYKRWKTKR